MDKNNYRIITKKNNYDDEDIISIILEIYKEKIWDNDIKNIIMTDLHDQFYFCSNEYIKMISKILDNDIPSDIQIKMRNMKNVVNLLKKINYVDNIIIKTREIYILEQQKSSYFNYINPIKIFSSFLSKFGI